ncbi:MAG: hypothetical protein P8H13_01135 [Polaribacter sp.]|nr:hypothetical protein [Polaribacter sp.]MDG1810523.1 hypothetical protein [Polaribacter sp.]MDG1994827.1 hypothetical protein [Polaribacter sp.]
MYKVRVILDTKEDVIRTLTVNNSINLEELHLHIAKAFGFNGQEMASFYRTDFEWNQGEEIPLFNMSEFGETASMNSCILKETLPNLNDKLIYVYDFFKMWSFYVEVIDSNNELLAEPKIIMSIGEVPDEAPEKEFVAENNEEDFSDEEFESYDDYDFENY